MNPDVRWVDVETKGAKTCNGLLIPPTMIQDFKQTRSKTRLLHHYKALEIANGSSQLHVDVSKRSNNKRQFFLVWPRFKACLAPSSTNMRKNKTF